MSETKKEPEAVRFVEWWEKNIGDAGNGKFFYWEGNQHRRFKPATIYKQWKENPHRDHEGKEGHRDRRI